MYKVIYKYKSAGKTKQRTKKLASKPAAKAFKKKRDKTASAVGKAKVKKAA